MGVALFSRSQSNGLSTVRKRQWSSALSSESMSQQEISQVCIFCEETSQPACCTTPETNTEKNQATEAVDLHFGRKQASSSASRTDSCRALYSPSRYTIQPVKLSVSLLLEISSKKKTYWNFQIIACQELRIILWITPYSWPKKYRMVSKLLWWRMREGRDLQKDWIYNLNFRCSNAIDARRG